MLTLVFTHFQRNNGVSKSWLQSSDVSKALALIESWPAKDKVGAVIRRTPNMACFDHLVMAVDPLSGWVSKKGQMIVIGDATHAFIPTSGQGASQSIEDSAVVAICLELAGENRIPLGLSVMQKLRWVSRALFPVISHGIFFSKTNIRPLTT